MYRYIYKCSDYGSSIDGVGVDDGSGGGGGGSNYRGEKKRGSVGACVAVANIHVHVYSLTSTLASCPASILSGYACSIHQNRAVLSYEEDTKYPLTGL